MLEAALFLRNLSSHLDFLILFFTFVFHVMLDPNPNPVPEPDPECILVPLRVWTGPNQTGPDRMDRAWRVGGGGAYGAAGRIRPDRTEQDRPGRDRTWPDLSGSDRTRPKVLYLCLSFPP